VGVSRIHVTIDRLKLSGVDPRDARALAEALRSGLSGVLMNKSAGAGWDNSSKPVMRLSNMALTPGPFGARHFGNNLARTIGKGLKP
jgi:hypothetical protein